MRKLFLAALLLLPATPAFATGTIHCRVGNAGPEIYFVVGRGAASAISQMTLRDGPRAFTTGVNAGSPAIAQSWLDARELKVDVIDSNAEFHVAQLRARRSGAGRYRGTLTYRGGRHAITCEFED